MSLLQTSSKAFDMMIVEEDLIPEEETIAEAQNTGIRPTLIKIEKSKDESSLKVESKEEEEKKVNTEEEEISISKTKATQVTKAAQVTKEEFRISLFETEYSTADNVGDDKEVVNEECLPSPTV